MLCVAVLCVAVCLCECLCDRSFVCLFDRSFVRFVCVLVVSSVVCLFLPLLLGWLGWLGRAGEGKDERKEGRTGFIECKLDTAASKPFSKRCKQHMEHMGDPTHENGNTWEQQRNKREG